MSPYRVLLLVLPLWLIPSLALGQNGAFEAYIDKYAPLAVIEMERTGIPASITMAQALLESNAGRSDLARRGNNHFGIKCGGNWNGKTFKKKDDDRRNGRLVNSCFRRYDNVLESYHDHSDFLVDNPRYAPLHRLAADDYKGWARGLKKQGYATSSTYHRKLITLIETYDLHRLDRMSAERYMTRTGRKSRRRGEENDLLAATLMEETHRNDVRCLVPAQPTPVEQVAEAGQVSLRRVLKYNEQIDGPAAVVPAGRPVYMQPKRNRYRGKEKWHRVAEGETVLDIAVTYGVDLEKLRRRNRLSSGQVPASGQRIKLRGGKVKEPPALRRPGPETEAPRRGEEELDVLLSPAARKKSAEQPQPVQPEHAPKSRPGKATTDPLADPFGPPVTPETAPPTPETQPPPPDQASPRPLYHEVMPGDTLFSIARRHQVTVEEIKSLNNLTSDRILRGMKLRVK